MVSSNAATHGQKIVPASWISGDRDSMAVRGERRVLHDHCVWSASPLFGFSRVDGPAQDTLLVSFNYEGLARLALKQIIHDEKQWHYVELITSDYDHPIARRHSIVERDCGNLARGKLGSHRSSEWLARLPIAHNHSICGLITSFFADGDD
jgi:hypothetical protein